MSLYKHYSQEDVNLGDGFEARIKPILETYLGPLTQRSKGNRNDQFDFSNKKFFVDAKARRNNKNRYPTTMVGENKVKMGLDLMLQGFRVFFVFGFVDKDCLWELNRDEYEVSYGGRSDRGGPEIKSYAYVPINFLQDIITNAEEETPIRVEQPPCRLQEEAPEQIHESVYEGRRKDV